MAANAKAKQQFLQTDKTGLLWKVRLLGLLPLAFFIAHFWVYSLAELPHSTDNMLWMCNVSNLTLAIGLLFDLRWLTRLSVIWLIPGLPLWLLEVVGHGGWMLTSFLTHIGALIVGLVAMRWVRTDKWMWLYAFCWFIFIQQISRMVTSTEYPFWNVNVAHTIYKGYENAVSHYWQFWVITTLMISVGMLALSFILWMLFPTRAKSANS